MSIDLDTSDLTSFAPHEYCTFASEIGLRPGVWPLTLTVQPGFGNGLDLGAVAYGPDNAFVKYRQHLGCVEVTIYND